MKLPAPAKQQQPYRRGLRMPGPALTAMLRGRAHGAITPADMKNVGALVAAGRKARPARRPRGQRAPR